MGRIYSESQHIMKENTAIKSLVMMYEYSKSYKNYGFKLYVHKAASFNSDLNFDTSAVTTMTDMFHGAYNISINN